jgi:hypothetical protein
VVDAPLKIPLSVSARLMKTPGIVAPRVCMLTSGSPSVRSALLNTT